MKSWVIGAVMLAASLNSGVQAKETTREELIERAKTAMTNWQKGSQTWMGRVREIPDYASKPTPGTYAGESSEGTVYLQYPGKYRFQWDAGGNACSDGEKVVVSNGNTRINELELKQTPFWLLAHGQLGSSAKILAVSEEDVRLAGKKQKVLLVDLQPASDPRAYKSLRLYVSGTGQPALLGFRVPAEPRSGWSNPEYIHYWLRDFHKEKPAENVFAAPVQ